MESRDIEQVECRRLGLDLPSAPCSRGDRRGGCVPASIVGAVGQVRTGFGMRTSRHRAEAEVGVLLQRGRAVHEPGESADVRVQAAGVLITRGEPVGVDHAGQAAVIGAGKHERGRPHTYYCIPALSRCPS